jgi:hypothetical protein
MRAATGAQIALPAPRRTLRLAEAAMCEASQRILTRLIWAAPAAVLRTGCVALFVCVSGCGGGADGAPPPNTVPTPALSPAPNPTPAPMPAPGMTQPAPAQLVVGTAQSIDGGASGNPTSLRVARSANGDGFAVWLADDGTRHNLWANRYRAATAAWGSPINIEASSADIDDFDLAVDASGNATVAWHEVPPVQVPQLDQGVVMSARFDTGAGAWTTPVPLNTNAVQPRVASDATGAVLAVYVFTAHLVRGRFFDPVSGTWQPEAAIEQNNTGTGFSFGPAALLDGSGNALVAFSNGRIGVGLVASNYFSRSTGGWVFQLPPSGIFGLLGGVPGSFAPGDNNNLQLAISAGGDFLLAWQTTLFNVLAETTEIRIAHFTSSTRTWSTAQTLVPINTQNDVQLQRMGSDAGGNALLLWTESDGLRTALKAVRLDQAGATCSAAQVIDSAVGGGAARADLAVDPLGHAMAIWQQFEGGRPDDGSRSNIAINRLDGATGAWASAVLAETQPGNAISPRASTSGGQALLGWIQEEGGANRVKALLQPLTNTPGQ